MNIVLWILQILLAVHTAIGAVWKFSNSEQAVPSLAPIPHGVWLGMAVLELLLSVCLIVPVFDRSLAILVPIAALLIAGEMLLFSGLHLFSGEADKSPVIYWMVVAALCGLIAYGRLVAHPL